jgi:hypothetical protein
MSSQSGSSGLSSGSPTPGDGNFDAILREWPWIRRLAQGLLVEVRG